MNCIIPQNTLGTSRHEPLSTSVDELVNIIVLQKISEPSEAVSCSFDHNPRPNKRQHLAPQKPTSPIDLDVSDDELKTLSTSGPTKKLPPHILQSIQEECEMATFLTSSNQPLPFDGMEFHTTTTVADDSYETRRKFLKRTASSLYETDVNAQAVYKKMSKTLPTFVARSAAETPNLVRPTPISAEGIKLPFISFDSMTQSVTFNP